ncbi:MAG: carbohydrate ABC transporter permease, partial [Planctomycetota bacterium]
MSRESFGYLLLAPAILLVAVFLLYPILATFVTSLHIDQPVLRRHEFVGLDNYGELLEDRTAHRTIGFTLMFVGVSVALEVLVGLMLALVIHRAFRGRGLVRAAVLVPWAIPTVVTAILWKYMF